LDSLFPIGSDLVILYVFFLLIYSYFLFHILCGY